MNFSSAGGQITINGNTDHITSDDHTSNNTTTDDHTSNNTTTNDNARTNTSTDDNSRTINDNSSGCNFYNGRVFKLTTHHPQRHAYPTTTNHSPSLDRTFIPPYHPYNNHKHRIFQPSNQFKETGNAIRAELRNKESQERKNMRKKNNNKCVDHVNFNEMNYGFADLLNDMQYTHNAVIKMDAAYCSLLNSNARNALSHKSHKYNSNNNNRRCSDKMGIKNAQSYHMYDNNNNNNNNNSDNRLELPNFVSSLFTNPLDIDYCNKTYKILISTCDFPSAICANIAEFATGLLIECENCAIEILVLQSHLYSNACPYYYFDPTVNTNKNKSNYDVNGKTNAFCGNCQNKLKRCQLKMNNFGDASRRMNIVCSAVFINDNINNNCLDCRRGRILYMNGNGVEINCTNDGLYTCSLMDGSGNKY